MMIRRNLWPLLAGLLLAPACQENDDMAPATGPEVLRCNETPEACAVAQAGNAFGLELFRNLHQRDPLGNLFISPHSVHTALSMTLQGASGQTYTDMEATLHAQDLTETELREGYSTLLNALPVLDPDVQLLPANSIWHRDDFLPEDAFLQVNQEYFLSEVRALDFNRPEAVDIINGWISDNTEGLIPEMLDMIPGNAVMYLINAIYFKGGWTRPFNPKFTEEQAFRLADGSIVQTPMMNMGETVMPYLATEHFEAVDLAYGDSVVSMALLLPREGSSMDEVVAGLTAANWADWSQQFANSPLLLQVPKFEMRFKAKLNDPLTDLGMGIAFQGGLADFSRIAPGRELRISRVLHEAVIEVNEEGSEAAAATIVEIVETSVPQIPSMIFNRPFLFVIWEKQGGTILFAGKLMDPRG